DLAALTNPGITVPEVNDQDSNGIDDAVEQSASEAAKEAKDAETRYTDVEKAIADKGGIINPADKLALDNAKKELDDAIDKAQELVNQLPDSPASLTLHDALPI